MYQKPHPVRKAATLDHYLALSPLFLVTSSRNKEESNAVEVFGFVDMMTSLHTICTMATLFGCGGVWFLRWNSTQCFISAGGYYRHT